MAHSLRGVVASGVLALCLASGAAPQAAPETWTGKIADAMCGVTHGAKGGTVEKDRACTIDCTKNMGSQFVLVIDKKVFKIKNQKFADLPVYAGQKVLLTGEIKGDTITVSKIEPSKDR